MRRTHRKRKRKQEQRDEAKSKREKQNKGRKEFVSRLKSQIFEHTKRTVASRDVPNEWKTRVKNGSQAVTSPFNTSILFPATRFSKRILPQTRAKNL
jgi:hypothetical protein